MAPLSQKAMNDIASLNGWVSKHWKTVAIVSLILNAVLIVWRLL